MFDFISEYLGIIVIAAFVFVCIISSIIRRIRSNRKHINDIIQERDKYAKLLEGKDVEIENQKGELEKLTRQKYDAESRFFQYRNSNDDWHDKFDKLNHEYSDLMSEHTRLLSAYTDNSASIDTKLHNELHQLRIHRVNSIQTISELRKQVSSLEHGAEKQTKSHLSRIAKLESQLAERDELIEKLNLAVQDNAELRKQVATLHQLISDAQGKATALCESSFTQFDWDGDPDCLRLYHALNEHIIPNSGIRVKANFSSNHDNVVYITTLTSCTCPDFRYNTHGQPCKHMYALALQLGIFRIPENVDLYALICKYAEQKSKVDQEKKEILRIVNTRSQRSPWLAKQLAQYKYERELAIIDSIPRTTKKDVLKEIVAEKRAITKERNMLKYQLDYLCLSFPWIEEFITDKPSKEMTAAPTDVPEWEIISDYLSAEEYSKLSNTEKYQLALDRYEKRHRSRSAWEAGIIYERFVGYFYEQSGYAVQYRGALDGYEDMGRDIIAAKDGKTHIIQCKRWKTVKTVHEKHIFQLYGSTILYRIAHPQEETIPVFVTTTELSDRAVAIARELNVIVYSNVEMVSYPKIKCNISKSGEKIYHLPFDQQYDHIVISPDKGECYCMTVAEAEDLGFRRAKKWLGSNASK